METKGARAIIAPALFHMLVEFQDARRAYGNRYEKAVLGNDKASQIVHCLGVSPGSIMHISLNTFASLIVLFAKRIYP